MCEERKQLMEPILAARRASSCSQVIFSRPGGRSGTVRGRGGCCALERVGHVGAGMGSRGGVRVVVTLHTTIKLE
jgi:hypothetical protein